MARILAVDLPAGLGDLVGAEAGAVVEEVAAAELLAAVDEASPSAVVIGPRVTEAPTLAAAVYRRDRDLPVVVLAQEDRLAEVRGAIRVSPFVSRDTRCLLAVAPPAEVARVVAELADARERRRAHATTMARVRDRVVPDALLRGGAVPSRYLGQLLDHAPIGVIIVGRDGTIAGWNPKATEILGRPAPEAVGAPLSSLFPASQAGPLAEALGQALAGDEAVTSVVARVGPQGSEQHVDLTLAAVDSSMPGLGALALVQDVTERVENQRELADRARSASLAAEVGMVFTSAAPLDEKLHRAARSLVRHLDAAFARIWLAEPGGAELVLRASAGIYTHLDGPHGRIPVGAYKIGRIAATQRPHLTNRVVGDPEISDPDWAAREAMVAFAGYPLLVGDDLVGVMALFARRPLSPSALQALGAIADTVAVGVEQARDRERLAATLEREHAAKVEAEMAAERFRELAKTLQQSLLPPRLPDIPGLELAARYHWAGDGTTVGGDFYDAFALPDGSCCAVMGDVSGKGVEAAKLTSLARYTLRAAALTCSAPSQLLATLNAALAQQVTGEEFCTVAVVVMEGAPGGGPLTLTAASAGHPCPVVVRGDGTLDQVGSPGPPAGLFPEAEFTEGRARLEPADVVVLVTDGVIEARSPQGGFRPTLLHDTLARCARWCALDVAAAVESSVLAFEDAVPRDDLAVLAIRVGGAANGLPEAGGRAADPLAEVLVYALPAQPAWVPGARRALSEWLAARPSLAGQAGAALLVATELVTNAVRAARSRVELRAWESGGRVAIEVRDDGYGLPRAALERSRSGPDDEYGRGLAIVRALSERHDLESGAGGTVVRCLVG